MDDKNHPLHLFVHPETIGAMLSYPFSFYLSAKFLELLGVKNPMTEANYLTGQVMRCCGGLLCAIAGAEVLLRDSRYSNEPFRNFQSEDHLDSICRYQFIGFHMADLIEIIGAYKLGYEKSFRWDMMLHHLAMVIPAINYGRIRAEGGMSFILLADAMAFITFLILLFRHLTKIGVISPDLGSVIKILTRTFRFLFLILYRVPMWCFLFYKLGIRREEHPDKLSQLTYYGLAFTALLMLFIDTYWASKMPKPIYWAIQQKPWENLFKKKTN